MGFLLPMLQACFAAAASVLFLFCTPLQSLRRYALAVAFFFVVLCPSLLAALLGWLLFENALARVTAAHTTGIGAVAGGQSAMQLAPVAIAGVIGALLATLAHGWVLRRFTRTLFRIYLAAASFAVGAVATAALSFAVGYMTKTQSDSPVLLALEALLALTFGALLSSFCLKRSGDFRGPRPVRWQPVAVGEY